MLPIKCKYKKGLLIDGFVRNMERLWCSSYSVPKSITDSIYNFHSKLMSLIALQSSPQKLEFRTPNCVYYHSRKEDKEYIILTPDIEDTDKCYAFDIKNNKWIHLTTYPDGLRPENHTLTMDEDNNDLYVTHGDNHILASFNMFTKQWNVISKNKEEGKKYNITHCDYAPSVMIPFIPKSELHVVGSPLRGNSVHIRYNKSKKQFVCASTNGIENNRYLKNHAMAYIDNKKILMVLGGENDIGVNAYDKIWFTKCSGGEKYVWNEFPLKLPHCATLIKCTVVFDSVLIVFYRYDYRKPFMWILDFNDTKYEWIKPILSETEYPKNVRSLIATKSNYLHLINVPFTHSKIHLSQFIPRNLYNKYVIKMNKD